MVAFLISRQYEEHGNWSQYCWQSLSFLFDNSALKEEKKKTDFHHKNVSNVNIGCIFNFSYSCEEGNNYFCKL